MTEPLCREKQREPSGEAEVPSKADRRGGQSGFCQSNICQLLEPDYDLLLHLMMTEVGPQADRRPDRRDETRSSGPHDTYTAESCTSNGHRTRRVGPAPRHPEAPRGTGQPTS
ncbi:hypothetical protein E2C01_059754 [Portunus trituberculatus]|uniref:Uncharacterized protein n=1 Tax=Portunus trituberculatus TaxID=210409 RepID=A0A5B7H6Q0_PORTR|nr:hypothetical protein [Portunus trituberculatus]